MRRVKSLLLPAAILAAAVYVRLIALGADPPGWLSWSAGIYSDEGIYAEDARLWVLYGQHMQGDFHASVIAPLWHWLLLNVFARYGISLVVLRTVSVVFGIATLAAFATALRVWYDTPTALIGLALLSVSAPFVMYNRLGLLESSALFWLVLGYLALGIAERSRTCWPRHAALVAAGLVCGIAVVWKGTFLLGALALAGYAFWRHRAPGAALAIGMAVVAAVYGVAWYAPHRAELARASHYYLYHQYLPRSLPGVWANLKRGLFTGNGDGIAPYLLRAAFPLWALALFAARDRDAASRNRALLAWIAIPALAFLFSSYTPSRYYLVFWPALAALAARGALALPLANARRPEIARAGIAAALVAGMFAPLGVAYRDRMYTMHDDARTLARVLPADAWIAGQFAPSLCLDNSLRTMYIQKGLANDPAALALQTLPITHVLATRTSSSTSDPWRGAYSHLILGPGGLYALPVGQRFAVDVYANIDALP